MRYPVPIYDERKMQNTRCNLQNHVPLLNINNQPIQCNGNERVECLWVYKLVDLLWGIHINTCIELLNATVFNVNISLFTLLWYSKKGKKTELGRTDTGWCVGQ